MAFVAVGLLLGPARCTSPAYAHDDAVKACFGTGTASRINEVVNENGTLSELYDRNGDGQIDIEVVSVITRVEKEHDDAITYHHDLAPLLYIVDQNYDGQPDMVFVDPVGKSRCEDLRVYQNLLHNSGKPDSGKVRM